MLPLTSWFLDVAKFTTPTPLSSLISCGLSFLIVGCYNIATYSGFSIHDVTLLLSKSQYTTVKHSQKLFEHTYTSNPYGLGTLTPILAVRKLPNTPGQSVVGLSVHLHTTTALRRIVSLTGTSPDDRISSSSAV
jgi:hypothetical protein